MSTDSAMLDPIVVELSAEYAGIVSTETVQRFVAESATQLASEARITVYLPVLVRRFAHERLRALAQAEGCS